MEKYAKKVGDYSGRCGIKRLGLKAIISKATGGAVRLLPLAMMWLMDLGVDSMAALEVVNGKLETQFGVSITDMEAGKEAFTSIIHWRTSWKPTA